MSRHVRQRPSLIAALALVGALGAGSAPAAAPLVPRPIEQAPIVPVSSSPLKEAVLLTDRAARALQRKARKKPGWSWVPRKDKGALNGRGDWLSQKKQLRRALEAQYGPLSGRQFRNLRKARRRIHNPASDLRTKLWAIRVVRNVIITAWRRAS